MWNRFITYLVLNLNIKKNLGSEERTILTSCSTTSASPRLTRHGIFSNEGERESDVSIIRVWTELIQGYLHRPHLEYHFEFGPRLASKFRVFDTNLKLHSVPTKKNKKKNNLIRLFIIYAQQNCESVNYFAWNVQLNSLEINGMLLYNWSPSYDLYSTSYSKQAVA